MQIDEDIVHFVKFEGHHYIRLSRDNWLKLYGESREYHYDDAELEAQFMANY